MDVRTIVFCVFFVNIFLSIYIFSTMSLVKMYPGVKLWFYSFVIGTLMYLSMALRGIISDYISYLAVNVAIGVVATLRFVGIRKFFGKHTHRMLYWFPLFYALVTAYYYFIDDSLLARTVAGALLQDVVVAMIVYLLFGNMKRGLRLIFTITGIVFMLYFAIVTVRASISVFHPQSAVVLSNNLLNILLFLSLLATDLAWGTVFFSMNSYRLRKELEESNETQNKLYSYIAHDLRGPIGSLVISMDMLASGRNDLSKAEYRELLSRLSVNTKNTFTLLENLLMWGKLQAGMLVFSPEAINLSRLVEEVFSSQRNQAQLKNIALRHEIPTVVEIIGDRQMVSSVIQNLTGNALKFSHAGGEIVVRADVNAIETRISVEDSGIGIESRILEPLLSGSEFAPGLGLGLCREFVKIHHGRFWAESTLSQGSVFSFSIPLKS